MIYRLTVLGWLLAATGLNAQSGKMADLKPIAPVTECSQLVTFDLTGAVGEKARIEKAEVVADGKPAPYCRVTGVIEPAVRFEVRLPTEKWTQRYLQTGCGGLCGTLNISVSRSDGCVPATNGEIALASTDMGHSNGPGRGNADPTWAVDNPQSRVDFAYRGVHVTALAAKALIGKFYGQKPRYSYFSGCSDGGREALMEAQRYPDDFDGIAAGAPAMNFTTQNSFYHGWNAMKNTGSDGKAILSAAKLPVLHAAVVNACDELDGLKDGLISNPPSCRFEPEAIVCKPGQDAATCLTGDEASVAREIYRGAHDEAGNQFVISGPQPGSELSWAGVYVPRDANSPIFSAGIALGTIKYLAYEKPLPPEFGLKDFHFDQATFRAISPMHALYDATDPDLRKFAAQGGKLLLWHGWSDPHISPLNTVAYFNAMQKTMGAAKTAEFSRTYLFPGGYHCNGGDGPFDFPLLSLIMNWVEGGEAPEAIIASQSGRTRPVYPYPMVATYKGTGDPNLAANFEPKPTGAVPAARLNWQGASFYSAGYEKWCSWTGKAMACH